MKIFKRIEASLDSNLPFVVYRKPNKEMLLSFFQKDDTLHVINEYSKKGFVFAPFDDSASAVLIPFDDADLIEEKLVLENEDSSKRIFETNEEAKEYHKSIVSKGIKTIEKGAFKKVVLSRKEIVNRNDFEVVTTFKRLLNSYKNACVYIWFHPKISLWMGATPETLVKIKGNYFETMSLAGTQVYKGEDQVSWQSKEIDEQQLVTDYVLEKLKFVCTSVNASKVKTVRAGNLLHLKTVINGVFDNDVSQLIDVLHPTPAVCGFPKDESKAFILSNEGYNRVFYTGFFGELNMPNSELFVNLRCMEVDKNEIFIYVGGGITKESNAEKEWKETVFKAKTIKNVL